MRSTAAQIAAAASLFVLAAGCPSQGASTDTPRAGSPSEVAAPAPDSWATAENGFSASVMISGPPACDDCLEEVGTDTDDDHARAQAKSAGTLIDPQACAELIYDRVRENVRRQCNFTSERRPYEGAGLEAVLFADRRKSRLRVEVRIAEHGITIQVFQRLVRGPDETRAESINELNRACDHDEVKEIAVAATDDCWTLDP